MGIAFLAVGGCHKLGSLGLPVGGSFRSPQFNSIATVHVSYPHGGQFNFLYAGRTALPLESKVKVCPETGRSVG